MSKTAIFVHIVFTTKYRQRTLSAEGRERLFAYMTALIKAKNCFVCAIGGYRDHLHILLDLHPTVALSTLVRELKTSSHAMIRKERFLPYFEGWQDGYYAGSISPSHRSQCEEYIRNQEVHHQQVSIESEMSLMASKYGFTYHERDLG